MAILVYDITRKESYDSMKNDWYKQLKDYADPDIIIGIAGNKSDLYDEEAVSEQEARDFAKSIGAVFGLTSAQGNTGINELFKDMALKFINVNSDINEQDSSKPQPKHQTKTQKEEKSNNIVVGKTPVETKPKKNCC